MARRAVRDPTAMAKDCVYQHSRQGQTGTFFYTCINRCAKIAVIIASGNVGAYDADYI